MRASRMTLLFALALSGGLAAGLGSYTFIYAGGAGYLTNDPTACASCHVMEEQYKGWLAGSHRQAAVCNDCHTPNGFFAKYRTKARNGFWHSFAFTTGRFPNSIQIHQPNRDVTEGQCRACHQAMTEMIDAHHEEGERLSCTRCHRDVGHAH